MGIEVGGRHIIPSVIPHLMRESRKYFFSNKKEKEWIPNQVGDDSGVVFGDDKVLGSSIEDFEDYISVVIPAKAGIQEVFVF